jgi:hypothetical protein
MMKVGGFKMVKLGRKLAEKEVALNATASHTIMLEGGQNPRGKYDFS